MAKFTSNGVDINIKELEKDSENWYTIKQQSYSIDKEEFLLKRFSEFYPKSKITEFDDLKEICNRSSYLRDWYAKTSLLYAQTIQLPVFLKEVVSAPDYEGISDKLKEYNDIVADKSTQIQKLSAKFDADRLEIESKYKDKTDVLTKDKVVRVLTMTVEDLPILLQLEITGFKPKDEDSAPSRKNYGRELLVNYQRSLIQLIINNPEVDIESIINDMRTK